tara:strand:- start:2799 stop:3206 length:408 start_codon:yes stop_codon:yes gene_type:complete
MNLYKLIKFSAIGLSLLGIVFVLVILSGNMLGIDMVLFNAYLVLLSVITFVVIFGLKNIIADKSNFINTIKVVGSFIGLFIICYFIASGEETAMRDGKILSATSSKLIGAALFMFYSLIIIASGIMFYFGFKNSK